MYQQPLKKSRTTGITGLLLAVILLAGCSKRPSDVTDPSVSASYNINEILSKGKPGSPVTPALNKPLGTWWWTVNKKDWDTYLNFAWQNGVSEIYFYTTDFSGTTGYFIEKAGNKGIRVFLLAGSYQWINDRTGFTALMSRYTQYQNSAGSGQRFSGIHLDVEPHQDPEFQQRRAGILQQYIDFVVWVSSQYPLAGNIDFDIPFWLDDMVMYKGAQSRLYEAVINEATRVFIMSYRDTAAKMYEVSKEEIAFATLKNKQIFLGAETAPSGEGDIVSYVEEGKAYMYNEFQQLATLCGDANYGLSVHHIKSWYNMKK